MFKKVALGVALAGMIGVLVAGGVIRTLDKTENVAEARGLGGQGRAGNVQAEHTASEMGTTIDVAAQGNGRGGAGQREGVVERQYLNNESAPEAWNAYTGIVTQAPASGVDMVIVTEAGEELMIGTGPGYMETQGFVLQEGDAVQVEGYWEAEEFKATLVTRLSDGAAITLRDDGGRPAWAGAGRNAQSGGRGRSVETVPQVEG